MERPPKGWIRLVPAVLVFALAPEALSGIASVTAIWTGHTWQTPPTNPGDQARPIPPEDSVKIRTEAEAAVLEYVNSIRFFGRSSTPDPDVRQLAVRERERAILALDKAALEVPGDDWIAGHRVGLRVKQGWWGQAGAVATACEASPWWCAALEGFVHHGEGDRQRAHTVFQSALDGMPADERCAWVVELGYILDGALGREFRRAGCAEQLLLEGRIWWLADPIHLEPWNDRRSEHLARVVTMRLHHESLALVGAQCSVEHHAEILARGWPETWWSWEASWSAPNGPGLGFLPSTELWEDPWRAMPASWGPGRRSRERYEPWFGTLHGLDQQTAFLPRGDSVLVVAVTDLRVHPFASANQVRAGISLTPEGRDRPRIVEVRVPPDRLVLQAHAPGLRHVVSVEALTPRSGAARARFAHGLSPASESGLVLSDLILVEWVPELGHPAARPNVGSILPRILPRTHVTQDEDLGLFWEVASGSDQATKRTPGASGGLGRVRFSLVVGRLERGPLRRIVAALRIPGFRAEPGAVAVSWTEEVDLTSGPASRVLRIELGQLEPGVYEIELLARIGEEPPARVTRRVSVR